MNTKNKIAAVSELAGSDLSVLDLLCRQENLIVRVVVFSLPKNTVHCDAELAQEQHPGNECKTAAAKSFVAVADSDAFFKLIGVNVSAFKSICKFLAEPNSLFVFDILYRVTKSMSVTPCSEFTKNIVSDYSIFKVDSQRLRKWVNALY